LEKTLQQNGMLRDRDSLFPEESSRPVHRERDRLKSAFQIRDCHPYFIYIFPTQCRCQFRTRQRCMRRQLHCRGLVLQRCVRIKHLVDPNRERESSAIKAVLFEGIRGVGPFLSAIFFQQRVDLLCPIFSLEQLRPAHFAGDDLVPIRVIKILLQ